MSDNENITIQFRGGFLEAYGAYLLQPSTILSSL